ncbi:MAG: GspE/PulE family protein [Candidatus Marinimicrobia bacterium]|nr:GspE/PulE family protein [Candidatus Neomarinimicrobiota bacterium]
MNETVNKTDLKTLYTQFGIAPADLKKSFALDKSLAAKLTEEVCRYHQMVPLEVIDNRELRLAMLDPFDMMAQQIAESRTGYTVKALVCDQEDIDYAISRLFSGDANFEETLQELVEIDDEVEEVKSAEVSVDLLRSQATDAPAVVFVNSLLVQAIQERASDIHIEPQENDLRVRLRIDGMLKELPAATKRLQEGVVARIKILSNMDIAERRVPQDGRVKFKIMGRGVDVRVSTIPGIYGEKIVMRILDKGSTSLNIEDLGMAPNLLTQFKAACRQAHGMVLVTGPTGSGKTTTLYSVLNYVNTPHLNIMTVEDPVEYRLNGINQIQARPNVGLTFANALRSFLRQDPDIIMVGEIRDLETGEIAIKAALTGHLVLSTLHTNDAVATIIRLLNMGIDKYLIASSVSVIVAQRLVRRICLACKQPVEPSPEVMTAFTSRGVDMSEKTFFQGKGCKQCSNTGYWGRMPLHEILFMSSEIKEMIVQDKSESELKRVAAQSGMVSLIEDGVNKAARGLTSLEEVMRVI